MNFKCTVTPKENKALSCRHTELLGSAKTQLYLSKYLYYMKNFTQNNLRLIWEMGDERWLSAGP